MKTKSHQLFRAAGMLTATTLALASAQLFAADNSDAFPIFDSYIKVSGQAASIQGDGASFQKSTGQSENIGAGIEELYYSRDLNKTTTVKIDGRALSGSEDYLIHLNLTKAEFGSVDVGYKRFRTFYDGVGGFFPGNGKFTTITQVYPRISRDMFVDRGEFWAEVKLARPDQPEVTIRYTNGTRNGVKDSTIWGDTSNSGQNFSNLPAGAILPVGPLPAGTYSNAQVRKNIPAYLAIDERHETLEGTIKHTIGKTTAQLTLTGDWSSKDDGRYTDRFPGERRSAVAPVAGALAAGWANFTNQVLTTTFDRQDTQTLGVSGTTVTEFNEKLTLRTGLAYQNVNAEFGGDRMVVTNSNLPALTTVTTNDFRGLNGKSTVDVYTGTVALDYKATENLTATASIRAENENAESHGSYIAAAPPAVGPLTKIASSGGETTVTPQLDLRYTGIRDLALYSTVSHKDGVGTENTTNGYIPKSLTNMITLPKSFFRRVASMSTAEHWTGLSTSKPAAMKSGMSL